MRPGTGSEWSGEREVGTQESRTGLIYGGVALMEGAWHRLEQIRLAIGYGVKGLEETRNLGLSRYMLRLGRALCSRGGRTRGCNLGGDWV